MYKIFELLDSLSVCQLMRELFGFSDFFESFKEISSLPTI